MTGKQVKQILHRNGYTLNDVGRRLGESAQNFSAALKVQDIKTGMLERIAETIGVPVTFFYGDSSQVANASGDNSTTIAGNNISNGYSSSFADLLSKKDEQLAKAQTQIDRLLGIIESMQKTK